MEAYSIRNLSFAYPDGDPVLRELSFSLREGSFTVLAGLSGCGKTTLLRLCKPELCPKGERTGEILFFGKPLEELPPAETTGKIGFVLQSPEEQLVTDKVWHELAFGLESLGLDQREIRSRVAEMAAFFGMESWFERDVSTLSGGQKQMLNLASVMAMRPKVLILDEPTSQLDPIAASELLAAVARLNRELGVTVWMTEHRLEEAVPYADEILILENGRLKSQCAPRETGKLLNREGDPLFYAMPVPMRVYAAVEQTGDTPVTIREGREWLRSRELISPPPEKARPLSPEIAAEGKNIWFRYDKNGRDVLKDLSFTVKKGEFLAIMGGNGAGKSTTLSLLAGIRKPYRGSVRVSGRVSMLPQDPQTLFSHGTVAEELDSLSPSETEREKVISLCRLSSVLYSHPYDLSGGEEQRAALAMVLLTQPELLLLDEPTKGLDASFKRELAALLRSLTAAGKTVILVSHDVEFCAEFADRCAFFFNGTLISEAEPREFFSSNSFYTTAASRMSRELVEGAVTCDDLIRACGAEPPAPPAFPEDRREGEPKKAPERPLVQKRKLGKRSLLLGLSVLLVLIPLTLWAGTHYFGGRKVYGISLLILAEILIPFFLSFEGRKPAVRELMTVAVLCALGIAGRAAFFMLPQVKPVVAVAVLAGAALGSQTGFLVGALTMLVSNMLFGQGPWTPWQMMALGAIGFLAGVLFYGRRKRPGRLPLAVYGVLASFLLYGGIVNPSAALMWQTEISWRSLLPYYLSGFPMDAVLAGSTAVFLWIFSQSVLEKLERIQTKYGLFNF